MPIPAHGYDPSRRASQMRLTTDLRTVMTGMRNRDAASGHDRVASDRKRLPASTIEETKQGISAWQTR